MRKGEVDEEDSPAIQMQNVCIYLKWDGFADPFQLTIQMQAVPTKYLPVQTEARAVLKSDACKKSLDCSMFTSVLHHLSFRQHSASVKFHSLNVKYLLF